MLFFLLWESFLNYLLEQEIKSQEIKQVRGALFSAVRAHSVAGGTVSTQRMKAAWQLQEYLWQSEKRAKKAATERARESLGCQNSGTSKRFMTVGETRVPIETSVKTKAKFSHQKSINLWSNRRVKMLSTQGQSGRVLSDPVMSAPRGWYCGTNLKSPEAQRVTSSQTQPLLTDFTAELSDPLVLKQAMKTYSASWLDSFPWTPNQDIIYF